MIVLNKNPQGYKEHVIQFINFTFGECVTIIDWLKNMKLYLCNIEESYKDTISEIIGNSGTSDLLLHIVHCCCACAVNE